MPSIQGPVIVECVDCGHQFDIVAANRVTCPNCEGRLLRHPVPKGGPNA